MLRKRRNVKDTGVLIGAERNVFRYKLLRASFMLLCVILAAIFVLPILWMLISSFKDTKEFLQVPPTLLPKTFDLSKVASVWKRGGLGRAYLSTTIIVTGKLAFCLSFCGLGGYVLSRLKPKGTAVVLAVVMWSMMMPSNLGMVPLYINIVNAGMLDNYLPLWFMAGANAYNTMLFKSFFDGISQAYLESARLDGAGELTIFSKIVMPLSKPVFMTISIFTVSNNWGEFMWPYLLLSKREIQPLGVRTYLLNMKFPPDEYLMILCFVVIPPIIFFLLFQKYIMEGVSLGGLKE